MIGASATTCTHCIYTNSLHTVLPEMFLFKHWIEVLYQSYQPKFFAEAM